MRELAKRLPVLGWVVGVVLIAAGVSWAIDIADNARTAAEEAQEANRENEEQTDQLRGVVRDVRVANCRVGRLVAVRLEENTLTSRERVVFIEFLASLAEIDCRALLRQAEAPAATVNGTVEDDGQPVQPDLPPSPGNGSGGSGKGDGPGPRGPQGTPEPPGETPPPAESRPPMLPAICVSVDLQGQQAGQVCV